MKYIWWKVLSIFILIYVFVFGLLTPLKPGVESVSTGKAKAGDSLVLAITGYNTTFDAASSNRLWLKIDNDHAIQSSTIVTDNSTQISAVFIIPPYLPEADKVMEASLVIDNDTDGAFVYPGAVFISQEAVNAALGKELWNAPPRDLHDTPYMNFPYRNILSETIRNTYFHVPLWFGMIILFAFSSWHSAMYLKSNQKIHDFKAIGYTNVGILYGLLGLITGAIWAKNTWGQYWSFDVKQNMAAISVLIYAAYFVLRGSFEDEEKKAKISATYNIFAFFAMIPLLFVIPRLTESLHPGNGGNPAFGGQDLDNTMRMLFYPAIIGFTLFGGWMAQLHWRIDIVREKILEKIN
ncbi:MAG: cytochrome c biogenesis protein CcsA [Saprospiraceae bacterium]